MSELDDLEAICLSVGDPLNNELPAPPKWRRANLRSGVHRFPISWQQSHYDVARDKPSLPKLRCLEST